MSDSGVSVSYFVAAFSSVFVGIFWVVFPGFFPLGIPKVQRHSNLVDLEKCCKVSIWSQRLVPIQKRTSPLKFDDLAGKLG